MVFSQKNQPTNRSPFRPQSGHIHPCGISPIRPYPPGKTAVFPKFSTFFQIRNCKNVLTTHRGPIYQIKASKIPCQTQRQLFRFDKYVCVGKTLKMDSCSKFWGNLEGIWGNPGEIPHIGWKIPGVYRVNVTKHMYSAINNNKLMGVKHLIVLINKYFIGKCVMLDFLFM